MDNTPESDLNLQAKGRFLPGKSGNPAGKPRGARNATTRAIESLLEGQAQALTQTAIDQALAGDTVALRLCLERLCPPRKERAFPEFELPKVHATADLPKLTQAILQAAADGNLMPSEAASLAALVGSHGKALEFAELESRLASLEQSLGAQR